MTGRHVVTSIDYRNYRFILTDLRQFAIAAVGLIVCLSACRIASVCMPVRLFVRHTDTVAVWLTYAISILHRPTVLEMTGAWTEKEDWDIGRFNPLITM